MNPTQLLDGGRELPVLGRAQATGRGPTVAGPGNSCRAWEAELGDLLCAQLSPIPAFYDPIVS